MTLPAKAENVAVVRHALTGLAGALDMEPDGIADLKTVVTEACMNVVIHAYNGAAPGPLEVRAWREDPSLVVVVRDYGDGIHPRVEPERQSLRLGLPLIAALSSRFEINTPPGGGTQVTMHVPLDREGEVEARTGAAPQPVGARMRIPAGELVAPILSRVIGMYAARAEFSVDRLSDAILLSDAISASEPAKFPDGFAEIAITDGDGAFNIRIGPLEDGAAETMMGGMQIPELGVSLEQLADEMSVETDDGDEYLMIRVARPA